MMRDKDKKLEDYSLEELDKLIEKLKEEVNNLQKEVILKNKQLAELLKLYKTSN